ncbi:LysR family transcriptional regulator [Acidovorax sp. Root217]|uniref:LysR family transcriptional regulator n=1 Tax=Acidovorax sp. Root217 TaxID=1736492 RepID=UPI00070E4547|nr:LysR family transcriptional regulator [Acidovorax sp. Root217]KRC23945.1 LysR family transcriptional regulator [Acidovorax sp. Root217]
MNISWLEDFLVLAAVGNFSRAAEDRHMTQPAFGRRVRALEEWLGVELFDRSTQPVRLTEAGQWFQGVAPELLAEVARLPGAARAVAEANSKSLRFAATHALSLTFMPGWLRSYGAHTIAGTLQLESDMLHRCEALLAQSKVQFVLCHAHAQAPGLLHAQAYPSVCVGTDVLRPVCAVGPDGAALYGLERSGAVAPLLAYSAESGLGNILHKTIDGALGKLSTQTVFTAHLASVLRTMALEGRGIAWLPQSLVGDDLSAGRLACAAASPQWSIELEIRVYRSHVQMGRAAEALWDAVAREAAGPSPATS